MPGGKNTQNEEIDCRRFCLKTKATSFSLCVLHLWFQTQENHSAPDRAIQFSQHSLETQSWLKSVYLYIKCIPPMNCYSFLFSIGVWIFVVKNRKKTHVNQINKDLGIWREAYEILQTSGKWNNKHPYRVVSRLQDTWFYSYELFQFDSIWCLQEGGESGKYCKLQWKLTLSIIFHLRKYIYSNIRLTVSIQTTAQCIIVPVMFTISTWYLSWHFYSSSIQEEVNRITGMLEKYLMSKMSCEINLICKGPELARPYWGQWASTPSP